MEKIWLVKKISRIRLIYYIQTVITISILTIILLKSIHRSSDLIIVLFLAYYSLAIISVITAQLLWKKIYYNLNYENYNIVLKNFKILPKFTFITSSVFIGYGLMQSNFNIKGEYTYTNNDIEVLINRITKSKGTFNSIKLNTQKLKLVLKPLKKATILHFINYIIWFTIFGLYLILIFNMNDENIFIITFLYYIPLTFPADIYYSSGIINEIWKDFRKGSYDLFAHNFITHFNNDILLRSTMGISRIQPKYLYKARKILLGKLIENPHKVE